MACCLSTEISPYSNNRNLTVSKFSPAINSLCTYELYDNFSSLALRLIITFTIRFISVFTETRRRLGSERGLYHHKSAKNKTFQIKYTYFPNAFFPNKHKISFLFVLQSCDHKKKNAGHIAKIYTFIILLR